MKNITVYVLLGEVQYEGTTVKGVFQTIEEAEKEIEKYKKGKSDIFEWEDTAIIQAMQLGECAPHHERTKEVDVVKNI